MNTSFIITVIFALAFLFLLNNWLMVPGKKTKGDWTVYGTDGCGWTRKQLKELDDKKVSYKYVNCDKDDCGGISSFPTLKNETGEVKVGFTTF